MPERGELHSGTADIASFAHQTSGKTCVTHAIAGLAKGDGGPSYSVPALAGALARTGASVRLRTIEVSDPLQRQVEGAQWFVHPLASGILGRTLRISPDLERAMAADAGAGAILHSHGLWLMPNVYAARVKRNSEGRVALVHSIRGMLGPGALRISAWKKRPFWWLLQRSAIEAADCLHATADSEYEEIRAAGLKNPVAVIPNGIELPSLTPRAQPLTGAREVLSLGRIHPKKGLDRLVRAWAVIEHEFPDWSLRIVGPPQINHDLELRALAQQLGATRIGIDGPIYDEDEKLTAYRRADLFALPTINENFALTVAEALAAGVPVISTKGAPWSGLETHRCGWWVDHGVEPLASVLRQAMMQPQDELRAMGNRGRSWMARDFGWDRIASDMLEVYRWLKSDGEMPSMVHVD
jgi:glycosyltransferase involved in cell wall biosynthesis